MKITKRHLKVIVPVSVILFIGGLVYISESVSLEKSQILYVREKVQRAQIAAQEQFKKDVTRCPQIAELKKSGLLEQSFRETDPWDTLYRVECSDHSGISVVSGGPDGIVGTRDDIMFPPTD
jgi:hypothetical protein